MPSGIPIGFHPQCGPLSSLFENTCKRQIKASVLLGQASFHTSSFVPATPFFLVCSAYLEDALSQPRKGKELFRNSRKSAWFSGFYNPRLHIAPNHFQNRAVIFSVPWEPQWIWLGQCHSSCSNSVTWLFSTGKIVCQQIWTMPT